MVEKANASNAEGAKGCAEVAEEGQCVYGLIIYLSGGS